MRSSRITNDDTLPAETAHAAVTVKKIVRIVGTIENDLRGR